VTRRGDQTNGSSEIKMFFVNQDVGQCCRLLVPEVRVLGAGVGAGAGREEEEDSGGGEEHGSKKNG